MRSCSPATNVDRCAERDAAHRQPRLGPQIVAQVALRGRRQLVGQRRARALQAGIQEVAQRLLAGLHLLGVDEVQEMIVVESAEGAAQRIESVEEDPDSEQQRSRRLNDQDAPSRRCETVRRRASECAGRWPA